MRIFNIDGSFFSFLNKMADLCILNLVFLLCCLPIVTIGASCTALYTITFRMVENREGYIAKSFLIAFKENFKQATIIWVPSVIILFFILADIRIFSSSENSQYRVLLIGAYLILFIMVMFLLFAFPVAARFSNNTLQTIKNTCLMELRHLPFTACILFITVVPAILTTLLPRNMSFVYMLWILFGFSLTALGNSYLFIYRIFHHYTPAED